MIHLESDPAGNGTVSNTINIQPGPQVYVPLSACVYYKSVCVCVFVSVIVFFPGRSWRKAVAFPGPWTRHRARLLLWRAAVES